MGSTTYYHGGTYSISSDGRFELVVRPAADINGGRAPQAPTSQL